MEPTDKRIAKLKLILLNFEIMLGLKINFDKIEVVVVGATESEQAPLPTCSTVN
jgi:hypothetical protein